MPFIKSMITFFGEPTIKPPSAAPPIVTNSEGWINAPTWPPDIEKPPNTEPTTIMMPTMTSMSQSVRNEVSQELQFVWQAKADRVHRRRLAGDSGDPRLGKH